MTDTRSAEELHAIYDDMLAAATNLIAAAREMHPGASDAAIQSTCECTVAMIAGSVHGVRR